MENLTNFKEKNQLFREFCQIFKKAFVYVVSESVLC